MTILADEPVSIAKILDASFKLFKLSFSKIIGLSLIAGLNSAGLSFIMPDMFENIAEGDTSQILEQLPILIVSLILIWFVVFTFYGAIIYRINNVAKQQEDKFTAAIIIGFKKTPRMLFAMFLYYIAMVLGLVLLVVPGLILMMSLFLFGYFIVLEDKSAYQSLKSSHQLIWKDWWRTAAVFAVPSILILILFFIFGLAIAFIGIDETTPQWLEYAMQILSSLYMPYFLVLGHVQYHDLKLRKSGSDLAARLSE